MKHHPDELLAEPIRRSLWRMGWNKLRPLQEHAISAVMQRKSDLILAARTAAGKTEAAFLPILSDVCTAPVGSVRALYIGPLKALINDQFRRLEELCEYAEIPVHRWHGDVSADKKKQLVTCPGGVLLITPESLESLLINRSTALSRIFHSLSFVVIDELHALLGNERGTQLRSQLYRLDHHTIARPRILALSATIGDLKAAAEWIRPGNQDSVEIIRDEGDEKRIQFRLHAYSQILDKDSNPSDPEYVSPEDVFQELFDNYRGSKNLIFANSKSDVELTTDRLNELGRKNATGEEFLIHHGSISKDVREETERLMQGQRPYTAICSSTLELGIDIGNVRGVGQIGPCWSVSSMLQRLGRSGRRDGEPHQLRMFIIERHPGAHSELSDRLYPDLLQGIALTELMLDRWVEAPRTRPFDLSTFVQQILSVIAETGGILATSLFDRLVRDGVFSFINSQQFVTLLRGLASHDLIEQTPDGLLILGLVGERLVRHYEFYAAFISPLEYRVVFGSRVLGRLTKENVPPLGEHLILAGRRWQVVNVDHQREEVLVESARGRKIPKFCNSSGEIAHEIRIKMRDVLRDSAVPAYLDSFAMKLLNEARQAATASGLATSDVVPLANDVVEWFPWAGTAAMRTLQLLFEWADISAELRPRGLSFSLQFCEENRSSLERILRQTPVGLELAQLSHQLVRRKWDNFIPESLLQESFAADCLDLPGALRSLRTFVSN